MSGFTKLGEREVFRGYIISVAEGTFEAPDGSTFTRDIVHHPGAVSVVPLDRVDGDVVVVMVRQYRAPIAMDLLEVPAGVRDNPGEPPEETAARELAEEVGLAADQMVRLSAMHHSPGFCDELGVVFAATGLREVGTDLQGVEEAHMTIERVRLRDVPGMVSAGTISDAKTIIGCLMALHRLENGELSL